MSSVLKLILISVMVLMVSTEEEVINSEEIEIIQKKLCDDNIPKESKDLMIDCMEENFPFVLLEAMDSCIYEAIPSAITRDEIQRSLCKNHKNRQKVHNCMQNKQKDIQTYLSNQQMTDKFKLYKNCVDSALNKKQ